MLEGNIGFLLCVPLGVRMTTAETVSCCDLNSERVRY